MDQVPVPELQPPKALSYGPISPRSPDKQTSSQEIDPLLSLTTTAVADILRGTSATGSDTGFQDVLKDISASERAFGLRAAVASKNIEDWCSELLGWHWSGSFEHPRAGVDVEGIFEGSLPPQAVTRLESRLETIKDEYEELDLEELKGFIRSAHLMPSSRASSLYEVDFMALSQFQKLDDFTALITATIMRALPSLQHLRRLLEVWSVRLLVLHLVPGFLTGLESTKAAVDAAWKAIGYGTTTEKPHVSREAFRAMREVLQDQVTDLGSKIDAMLDALEGHQDQLPEHWIDDMEGVQADCENWIVVAEREVEEGEWQARRERNTIDSAVSNTSLTPASGNISTATNDAQPHHSALQDRLESIDKASGVSPLTVSSAKSLATDGAASGSIEDRASHKLPPLLLPTTLVQPGLSPPQSATSSSFSDASEPQIMDASPIQLIRSPIEEKSFFPNRDSFILDDSTRRASEHTVTSINTATNKESDTQISPLVRRSSTASIDSSISALSERDEPRATETPSIGRAKAHLSRASVASIEFFPRGDVRNITITRSSSNASRANNSPVKDEDGIFRTSTPSGLKNETHSQSVDEPTLRSSPDPDDSPIRIQKQRNRSPAKAVTATQAAEQEDEFFDAVDTIEAPDNFRREPKTLEDQLAARISSIISNIPANIKLKTGAEDEATNAKTRIASHQPRTVSAQTALRGSRSVTPALTLAPAADRGTKSRGNHDQSGIKLYHLHQPDREHPIKLYVRLVGEGGERVMVRVGGGWADLGEYLKEYAIHHGRRSASDGKFGVLTVSDTDQHTNAIIQSVESEFITPEHDRQLVNRKIRASSGISDAAPRTPERSTKLREETPGSIDSTRSGSHLDEDTPLGLAGPKNKEVELSPKKRAWVNGMLNQARQASAEKKKTNLSELGKVGSTRRFFKGKGSG